MNEQRKKKRAAFLQALLDGKTIIEAAKIAGVDLLKARLWAGSDDVKAVLQPNKRHEPVITYFQKGQ